MIEQLKTIQTGIAIAIDAEGFVDKPVRRALLDALTALSDLESHLAQYEAGDMASAAAQGFRDGVASVTQQEPVAWLCIVNTADAGPTKFFTAPSDPRGFPVFAAPVAQQPQAEIRKADVARTCPFCNEEWVEQPQAETDDSIAADAYGIACDEMERWQHERRKAGKDAGTTGSLVDGIAWLYGYINDLEAKQPQAEAVPQGSKKQAAELLSNKSLAEALRCDARGGVHANVWELDEAARRLEAAPQQAEALPQPPEDWSVFNTGAEVATGLTWAEAWDYMTPSRIERGWTAVCVADKSNIGIVGEKGGA